MGSIGRYIFRTTMGAFLMVLVCLTAVIWVTQALRDIDLVTNQGQTVLVFIGLTSLGIPILTQLIAPIALVIAVVHVLNKLSSDSEIAVMNAAGMSPWVLFRGLFSATVVVAIGILLISTYLGPFLLRELRYRVAEARADLVTNIVQPGRFISMDRGLTFHIRERRSGGRLLGIFVDDWRDPKERATFLAEEGDILRNDRGTFLVMANGSVQRFEKGQRDPAIVLFERYAFDLSQLGGVQQNRKPGARERFIWELLWPDTEDDYYKANVGAFRAELHERFAAIIYPFVFVIIAYAYLGAPRTNRQSRTMAVAAVIAIVVALRLIGFLCTVVSGQTPSILILQYAALAAAAGWGLRSISHGTIIEMPDFVSNAIAAVGERLARRAAVS